MKALTDSQATALNETAIIVGANPESLYRLILFESGWNPQAKNPTSSARGLIQFIDSTARDLGFSDSLDLVTKYPDIESQLRGPVAEYLAQWGPYPNDQALFMGVFYPAAIHWDPDQPFPAWVTNANPGIATPADYMAMVYKAQPVSDQQILAAITPGKVLGLTGILLIAGAAVALWYVTTQS
jgi:hypothetical protein